jgi:diacylglycerol kinase (ATP)
MLEFFRQRAHSFRYAFAGWWFVIRTQHNAWIHALASLLVFLIAFWLQLPLRDWAVLILAVAMVWMAEFMNTAIEALIDLVSPQQNSLAKISKDVAAAAVLITALAAAVIGFLIMGPPLIEEIQRIVK